MPFAFLPDRAVLRVSGPEARHFLHNVVTCNVETLEEGGSRFGAILTPQGKIICDFLVHAPAGAPDTFLLDAPRALAGDLLKRLTLYRLRAKVELALKDGLAVAAAWGEDVGLPEGAEAFPDPRLPALGARLILPREAAEALSGDAEAYDAHRIALGIPKGGADFTYGDAFPHETDMDQLDGIDFKKGCYVGQEVVSRMQHRGTARTRSVMAVFENAPEAGSEILAGEKTVGRVGSSADGHGIALVRLDRVADAKAAGLSFMAAGIEVTLKKPDWAHFEMGDA
ncbi:folate-binding protein YgfZ [Aquabacter sp. CN5-332]|uniref:CAF17-like 4Fe-4S cluster assembly/insertion protein YgfZ n=1 Tax=Aquabacter sp. CN5-332 TaxID=3156608 RepID=UPI0032B39761